MAPRTPKKNPPQRRPATLIPCASSLIPRLQVVSDPDGLDLLLPFGRRPRQRPDGDDALGAAPGDLGPIIGVGRVGEGLVLLELLPDGLHEVLPRQAPP